jgi:hypothetical protein
MYVPNICLIRQNILSAKRNYNRGCHLVENSICKQGLTERRSAQIIGLGSASDWLLRAHDLGGVANFDNKVNPRRRDRSLTRILRFDFLNRAIWALMRPGLAEFVVSLGTEEDATDADDYKEMQEALHEVLRAPSRMRVPGWSSYTGGTTLAAISAKYKSHNPQPFGIIEGAINTGDWSGLTPPVLAAALTAWSLEGYALDGMFGSRPGFETFIDTLIDFSSRCHIVAAHKILDQLKEETRDEQ